MLFLAIAMVVVVLGYLHHAYILPLLFGLFITSRPFEHDGYILSSPNTVVRYIVHQKPPFDRCIPRDCWTADRYGLYIFSSLLFRNRRGGLSTAGTW